MRDIKFRAKRMNEDYWIYGSSPVEHPSVGWGMFHLNEVGNLTFSAIETNTVGEFTGLYDSEGREVYEGDIIRFYWKPERGEFSSHYIEKEVSWNVDGFDLLPRYGNYEQLEVIGNIYENKDLID